MSLLIKIRNETLGRLIDLDMDENDLESLKALEKKHDRIQGFRRFAYFGLLVMGYLLLKGIDLLIENNFQASSAYFAVMGIAIVFESISLQFEMEAREKMREIERKIDEIEK